MLASLLAPPTFGPISAGHASVSRMNQRSSRRSKARPRGPASGMRVGIDLARVDETARSLERFGERYLKRLFTAREVADCTATPAQAPARLAARFAAKEAAIKVLRPERWIDWRSIEVVR